MAKYTIQRRPTKLKSFIAGSKAGADACKILEDKEGYVPFYIGYPQDRWNKVVRNILLIRDFWHLYKSLNDDDIVFVQWPFYCHNIRMMYRVLKSKCKKMYMLVHDIDVIRGQNQYRQWTGKFFKLASLLIVHSEPMKKYLTDRGYDSKRIKVLTAFDYLTNDIITSQRKRSKDVVFAGNLKKSLFLRTLSSEDLAININCYGKPIKKLSKGLTYKGAFTSEHVGAIEGSWGLVWDGDSLDACTTPLGEYQRYNAPHKLSLYIVAHLPVIVWDQAAMASYVKEKDLGICVSSLREISSRIDAITEEEYNRILENVKKESELLRNGAHLRKCLNE